MSTASVEIGGSSAAAGNVVPLVDLRLQAIPAHEGAASALNYHDVPVVLGEADSEPLVDVAEHGIKYLSYYYRRDRRNAPYYRSFAEAMPRVYCRRSVAEKLVLANAILKPYGVELLAVDGFRTIELQRELWEHFIRKGREALTNPTEAELDEFAGIYCSDPRSFDPAKPCSCPAHHAGTAVDVLLVEIETGFLAEMGGIFDDASSRSGMRYYETVTGASSQTDDEARANRRLLFWAMKMAGMVSYPGEYWHFDDPRSQFGIFNSGAVGKVAEFGPAKL